MHRKTERRLLFASTHTYLPQRVGGVESSTHDLCLDLRRRDYEVAVLATLEARGWLWLWNRLRRWLPGGTAFAADRRMGYPVYRGWKPAEGAAEVVRRFRPAAAVVQGTACVPLARAFLELELPTVLYLRDVEFQRLGGDLPRHPRLLYLANSRFTAARTLEKFGVESHLVPPLVRPEAYRTEPARKVVLYVNPHPWKGVETAFRLAERRPDIPFLFLEAWRLREDRKREYMPRAASLPNVEWAAPTRNMREVYRRARVVLAPSVWEEAWGRIATEAQLSGIPVLASDRGGLPESVGPGGILVDPDGPLEGWVRALSRMWDDPEEYRRLSEAALEHSRRREMQPEVIASRFLELVTAHAGDARPQPLSRRAPLSIRAPSRPTAGRNRLTGS